MNKYEIVRDIGKDPSLTLKEIQEKAESLWGEPISISHIKDMLTRSPEPGDCPLYRDRKAAGRRLGKYKQWDENQKFVIKAINNWGRF